MFRWNIFGAHPADLLHAYLPDIKLLLTKCSDGASGGQLYLEF